MKTPSLLRQPGHTRPHFPTARATPPTRVPDVTGNWRYGSVPRARWGLLLAVGAALGLHATVFYGFSTPPPRPRGAARPKPSAIVQMEMPPLPPDPEDEQPHELTEAAKEAVAVPQLADVPSTVTLSAFTQDLDLRPRTEVDLGSLKSMTIPVARGRSGGAFAPGAIFNLAQLDRVPQPISQPSPALPREMRSVSEIVTVIVEFVVDADGNVSEARVTSADYPEFAAPALAGVKRWKFRPGVLNGRKVATRMEVPLRFDLKLR